MPKFHEFRPDEETFDDYLERFQIFVQVNAVQPEDAVATFLNFLGKVHIALLKNCSHSALRRSDTPFFGQEDLVRSRLPKLPTPRVPMAKVAVAHPAATSKPEARHQVPDSPRAWYLGILCTIYGFFSWAGIGSSPVLYVGLLRRSGASREDASLPFTAMVCAYYVGSLVYGVLCRWLRERTLLVAASLVTSFSLLTSYFISDIAVLTVVLGVIHGTGVAAVGVVCGMLLSQYFVKYRATAFGLMSLTLSTTGVAFPPLAAWLLDEYGFAATLLVLGALSLHQLVCCVPLETWTPTTTSASPPHEADGQQAVAVATIDQGVLQAHGEENDASTARPFFRCIFLFICLTNAVACFAIFTYTLTIVDFANDNGFSHYNAAMIMTAMSVGWGGASLSMAPIVDGGVISKETVIFSSFVIQGSGLVLMVLLKTSYLWLMASGFMIGWGQGSRGFLPFVLLSETFKKRQTPVAFALMSVSCAVPFLARAPIIGDLEEGAGAAAAGLSLEGGAARLLPPGTGGSSCCPCRGTGALKSAAKISGETWVALDSERGLPSTRSGGRSGALYCLARGAPKGPNLPRARLNHQDALFPGHGQATHSQTWAGEPAWLGDPAEVVDRHSAAPNLPGQQASLLAKTRRKRTTAEPANPYTPGSDQDDVE
ncbi:hypothetical protein HPB47_021339 [Ixodes persulcatus]|uniref:Uncharacterized protein n=1 Tax=Ixodes persulcatus TaxID=34615 RepID=A0AC60QCW0_IXOPE|nr:hypothetical protein HPB47_021339 [Ixodes persulcatus]